MDEDERMIENTLIFMSQFDNLWARGSFEYKRLLHIVSGTVVLADIQRQILHV